MRLKLLVLLLLCIVFQAHTQDTIQLVNPSFESKKNGERIPVGWENTTFFDKNLPPDIQPGVHGVVQPPAHGESYIGLITQLDSRGKGLRQFFKSGILVKDSTYFFQAFLSKSKAYTSLALLKKGQEVCTQTVNHTASLILNIYGISSKNDQRELLAQSPPIIYNDWRNYSLQLRPLDQDYDGIELVVSNSDPGNTEPGNLLIDHCSPIIKTNNPNLRLAISSKNEPSPNNQNNDKSTRETIRLNNPSFELDPSGSQKIPSQWNHFGNCENCQPVIEPGGQLKKKSFLPVDGNNFIILLALKTGKKDAISQHLEYPLIKDSVYLFSVYATYIKQYKAYSGTKTKPENFGNPLILKIWGINAANNELELLGQTSSIDHDFWYQYNFVLTPSINNVDTVVLEAEYDKNQKGVYNGNIAIDLCSNIEKIRQ